MILSDYIFDFSSFQESIPIKEKQAWRDERMEMLTKIIIQISGLENGELTFKTIL